jgi:hypothetical protein
MDVAAAIPEIRRRIPSFRNREVFEEVVVKERSKTEVGAQFGLSQPRVSQIVEQVQDWLRQVIGLEGENWPAEQRLRYARNVTQMRLEAKLGEVTAAWDLSKQDKVVRRDSFSATGELRGWTLTTSNQCGKSGHIGQALNLVLALARLAGVDVTGKSIRDEIARQKELAAEQAPSPEVLQDFEPSKPLWNFEPQEVAAEVRTGEAIGTTACEPTVCTDKSELESASITPQNDAQNSYEFQPLDAQEDWSVPAQENAWSGEDWEEVGEEEAEGARKELLAVA